jgi:exportin-2 (importin alpha re-exporter)
VQPVLGVFQKLIASKANDHHGFALMTGMIRALPLSAIQPYLPTVFQLLFQRLSSLKTHKFVREFIVFMSAVVCTHGAGQLFELVDAVQPNIMMMILDQVWLPGLTSVNGKRERKVAAVALIKLVCDCPALRDPVQLSLWNKAAAGVVPLLENLGEDDEGNDEPGTGPAFTVHAFDELQSADFATAAREH